MSDLPSRLPARPSLEQLRTQAKERLFTLHATDPSARLADAPKALRILRAALEARGKGFAPSSRPNDGADPAGRRPLPADSSFAPVRAPIHLRMGAADGSRTE